MEEGLRVAFSVLIRHLGQGHHVRSSRMCTAQLEGCPPTDYSANGARSCCAMHNLCNCMQAAEPGVLSSEPRKLTRWDWDPHEGMWRREDLRVT